VELAVQNGFKAHVSQQWVRDNHPNRNELQLNVLDSGVHYWYDNRLDTDCDFFFPAFLMYNKGKLTGFGWDTIGKYDFTKRTEFPPYAAISVSSFIHMDACVIRNLCAMISSSHS
jgi:hypothetical protein